MSSTNELREHSTMSLISIISVSTKPCSNPLSPHNSAKKSPQAIHMRPTLGLTRCAWAYASFDPNNTTTIPFIRMCTSKSSSMESTYIFRYGEVIKIQVYPWFLAVTYGWKVTFSAVHVDPWSMDNDLAFLQSQVPNTPSRQYDPIQLMMKSWFSLPI